MKLEDIKIGQRVMVKACRLCDETQLFGRTEEQAINACKKNNGFVVGAIDENLIFCGDGTKDKNGDYYVGEGDFYPEELELIENYEEIPFIPLADKKEEKVNLNKKLAKAVFDIALLATLLSDDDESDK